MNEQKFLNTSAIFAVYFMMIWPAAFSGLTLDESGSTWVISGSIGETISRSISVQGQSPLYYLLLHLISEVAGTGEMMFRLISIIATLACAFVMLRITDDFILPGRHAGLSSALFYLLMLRIEAALDARPYALALLLFCCTTYALLAWCATNSRRWLVRFLIAALACFYAHYLVAVGLAGHLIWLIIRHPVKRVLPIVAALLLLAIPGMFQLVDLYKRSSELGFFPPPESPHVFLEMLPFELLFVFAVVSAFVILLQRLSYERTEVAGPHLILLILTLLAAPILLGIASLITGLSQKGDRKGLKF